MAKSAPVKYEVRWRQSGTVQWGPISSIDPTDEIVVEGLDRTKSYDFEVRAVSSCGARSAWVSSAQSIPDVGPDNIVLADVKTQADNAAADALAANQELANIASDNVLSQGEKPTVIRDVNVITAEQSGIDTQANAFGITTEKTAYDNAVSALSTYLATLTTPTLWSDLSGDTTIVGATFRSKFADVYTTRQALLNAIYAAAKGLADAAQGSADVAGSGVPVYNPVFKKDLSGWTFDTAGSGEWYRETGTNGPVASPNTYLVHSGVAGQTTTCAHNIGGGISVKPNQVVTVTVGLRALGANAGAHAYARIGWLDATGAEITNSTQGVTICTVDSGAGYFAQGVSRVYGSAPANAVRAIVDIEFDNHTSGYFTASVANITSQPSNLGEVPDGGGRYGVHQVDSNGLAIVDFSQAGHVNKTQDYIGDGATFSRVRAGQVVNGVVQLLGSGRNAISNPNFTQNIGGYGYSQSTIGGYIRDGWSLLELDDPNILPLYDAGGPGIGFVFKNGVSVPAGGQVTSVWQSDSFAVQPSANYALRILRQIFLAQALPAGLNAVSSVAVKFYDASGASIPGTTYYEKSGAFGNTYDVHTGAAPSNAATAKLQLYGVLRNSTGAAVVTTNVNTAEPLFVSVEFVQAADLDSEVVDGSTYARIKGTELSSGIHRLGIAGSGARLGDLRNQVMVGVGNYASGWSGGSISYSASTTSATLSVTSATLQYGSQSLAYNAASTTVSGSAGSTVKFYLYYDDPSFTGGSKALNATTSQISALANDGRLLVGSVSVTFPTSGTGSGGGGTGCPQVDEPVIRRAPDGSEEVVRAGDTRVGDYLLLSSGRWGFVSYSETKLQPGVRVVGSDGSTITCSASAPLETVDGTCVCAPHVRDLVLKHRRAGGMLVAEVFDAGDIWVQHITCEDDCFWVGDYSHHNLKPAA